MAMRSRYPPTLLTVQRVSSLTIHIAIPDCIVTLMRQIRALWQLFGNEIPLAKHVYFQGSDLSSQS